jgi:hypothetical protein
LNRIPKKGKATLFHGSEESVLLKCPYYQKLFKDSMHPHKISMTFFTELEKQS